MKAYKLIRACHFFDFERDCFAFVRFNSLIFVLYSLSCVIFCVCLSSYCLVDW